MEILNIKVLCSRCRGSGIDENLDPSGPCIPCNGTGYVAGDIIDITELEASISGIQSKLDTVHEVVNANSDNIKMTVERCDSIIELCKKILEGLKL